MIVIIVKNCVRTLLARTHSTIFALALVSVVFGAVAQRLVMAIPQAVTKTETIRRVVHLAPPGPKDSRYFYVPFDVPRNAVRINVSYQYDRAGDSNTIDIGLFDARSTGSDTDLRGFRGWSGGRRSE